MAKQMKADTPPEILRTNISSFILTLKALGTLYTCFCDKMNLATITRVLNKSYQLGIENILSFDLMSLPSVSSLQQGLESLYALGAIDDKTNLTAIGNQMAEFPTSPNVAKMLLEALACRCAEEILCVASSLQVRSLFYQPRTAKQQLDYDSVMSELMDKSGDHITYLNLMQSHDQTPLTAEECNERFINYLALKRSCEVRSQLSKFLRRFGKIHGIDDFIDDDERSASIRRCITAGFFMNIAKLGNDGQYYSLRGSQQLCISTASALHRYGVGSQYIVFNETFDGSKGGLETRSCSVVDARWLHELAPHYFSQVM